MDKKYYSNILDSKIPSYIIDEPSYSKFVSFLEFYFDWFNDTYNIQSLHQSIDIDSDYYDFLSYFQADFLPYIPQEISADKPKLIKIAREFYKAKGIPDSFKFLFRALYDSFCEVIPTRSFVFRASDGKWLVPKSVKIKSLDIRFFQTVNLRLFGVLSKTFSTIESVKISGKYLQLYLSNVERLYYSGEQVQILDSNNKEIYFLNGEIVQYDKVPPTGAETLSSKIIGAISSIDIDPTYRGQKYKVGDPVSIIGGLNPEIETPVGAVAAVSQITLGAIRDVNILNGGYGFTVSPNSMIDVVYGGQVDNVANCVISLVDYSSPANTTYFPIDIIETNYIVSLNSSNFNFAISANINSKLSDTFIFDSFETYPITGAIVVNGGGGYETPPTLNFKSYIKDLNNNGINLFDIGILAPIQIIDGGINYSINDTLIISGGLGDFAFAKIDSVSGTGEITGVSYYTSNTGLYTLGGMGYTPDQLPLVTVNSSTGSNASLIVPGILGSGVQYSLETDKIGAITSISLSNNGEDYIIKPSVSLRVQDIVVSNVLSTSVSQNTVVYQGSSLDHPTFIGYVDSFSLISRESNLTIADDIYRLRVYDYRGTVSSNSDLKVYNYDTASYVTTYTLNSVYNTNGYSSGVKIYGDGTAKASAKFLNGLIVGEGSYLNSDGQPSAYSFLQSEIYNNSTYFLNSELSYDSYKDTIYNIVHPTGFKLYPRDLLRSNAEITFTQTPKFVVSNNIVDFSVSLIKSNTNYSNCFVYNSLSSWGEGYWNKGFWGYTGNTAFPYTANTNIFIKTYNNMNVYSTVSRVDVANSLIYFNDYIQYKFPNLYSGQVFSNSVIIFEENYGQTKYNVNTFISVNDDISTPNNSVNKIIEIDGNIIYVENTFSTIYTSNVYITIEKTLESNNLSIYASV